MLDQLQNCKGHLEHEFGAFSQHIVPNSNAQPERKAVQEASLEPLIYPKQIWNVFLFEVRMKFREILFKYDFESFYVFQQKRELIAKETCETCVLWLHLVRRLR